MPTLADFLNESAHQDYPLLPDPAAFTGSSSLEVDQGWFTDIGVTFGISSGYDYSYAVNLVGIVSDGDEVEFTFKAGSTYFVFTFDVGVGFGHCEFADMSDGLGGEPSGSLGFAFLQSGDLSAFESTTGTWVGSATVDPVTVKTLDKHQVSTVNIANAPTTIGVSDCTPIPDPATNYFYQIGNIHSANVSWFNGMEDFAAGEYTIEYVQGAFKFAEGENWGVSDNWLLVTTDEVEVISAPALANPVDEYPTPADAENANVGQTATFTHTGGPLGLLLVDANYGDNVSGTTAGSPDPTWRIYKIPELPVSQGIACDVDTTVMTDKDGRAALPYPTALNYLSYKPNVSQDGTALVVEDFRVHDVLNQDAIRIQAEGSPTIPSSSVPAGAIFSDAFDHPHFPLFIWLGSYEDLPKWKSRGINTMLYNNGLTGIPVSLATFSARARSLGIRIWRYPASYFTNPTAPGYSDAADSSLEAWSLIDEPTLHGYTGPALQAQADAFRALPPSGLPTFTNFEGSSITSTSSPVALYNAYINASDWLCADWYPINRRSPTSIYPIVFVGLQTEKLIQWSKPLNGGVSKPVGAIIECSFQELAPLYPGLRRCPTPAEFRAEIWTAIIYGCRMIGYFPENPMHSVNDATPADVAQEMTVQNALIQSLAPVLLADGCRLTDVPSPFIACLRFYQNNTYKFVLNLSSLTSTWQNGDSFGPYEMRMYSSVGNADPYTYAPITLSNLDIFNVNQNSEFTTPGGTSISFVRITGVAGHPTLGVDITLDNLWIHDGNALPGVIKDINIDQLIIRCVKIWNTGGAFQVVISPNSFVRQITLDRVEGDFHFQCLGNGVGCQIKLIDSPNARVNLYQWNGGVIEVISTASSSSSSSSRRSSSSSSSTTAIVSLDALRDPVVEVSGLTGDILINGGQYAEVNLAPAARTVIVGVTENADAGGVLPCKERDLLVYPPGYSLAAPKCNDLIYTFNGISADPSTHAFTLEGSLGITIAPRPDGHSLNLVVAQPVLFRDFPESNPCDGSEDESSSSSGEGSGGGGGGGGNSSSSSSSSSSRGPTSSSSSSSSSGLPCSGCGWFSWNSGIVKEHVWGGPSNMVHYSPVGSMCTVGKTYLSFTGTSEDFVAIIHESQSVTQTYDGVPGHTATFTLPSNAIILRNTHGWMIESGPNSCRKVFTNGTNYYNFHAGPPGNTPGVPVAQEGFIREMENGGFLTRSWPATLTVAELASRGWINSHGNFRFKFVLIPGGKGFVNITGAACDAVSNGSSSSTVTLTELADLQGLRLDLNAASLVGIVPDAEAFETWPDDSGWENDVINAGDVSSQPFFLESLPEMNDHPVVKFNGGTIMQTAGIFQTWSMYGGVWFCVLSADNPDLVSAIFSSENLGDTSRIAGFLPSNNKWHFDWGQYNSNGQRVFRADPDGIDADTPYLLSCRADSKTKKLSIYRNGELLIQGVYPFVQSSSLLQRKLSVGMSRNYPNVGFRGHLARLAFVTGDMSDSTFAAVNQLLMDEYGL